MAYLNNTSITVDAVLTKKGRELLSKGMANFKITKFALSDDEIDYSLWNPLHPSGSDYYGKVIENMPILEAVVDETQSVRYKLISIDNVLTTSTSVNLPYIELEADGGGLVTNGSTHITQTARTPKVVGFSPRTRMTVNTQSTEYDKISEGFGYTFIVNISKSDIVTDSLGLFTSTESQIIGVDSDRVTSTAQSFSGDGDYTSIIRVGSSLRINLNSQGKVLQSSAFPITIPITVIGNQTGAQFSFKFTINEDTKLTTGTGV